jgi:hypothetical protein
VARPGEARVGEAIEINLKGLLLSQVLNRQLGQEAWRRSMEGAVRRGTQSVGHGKGVALGGVGSLIRNAEEWAIDRD